MSSDLVESTGTELMEIVHDTDIDIDPEAQEDINEVRETYKTLVEKGKEGLDIAYTLVEGSEHPRAIEVFSGLLTTIGNINGKILDLHETKHKLRKKKSVDGGAKKVTNNMFVGSPAELLEAMAGINGRD